MDRPNAAKRYMYFLLAAPGADCSTRQWRLDAFLVMKSQGLTSLGTRHESRASIGVALMAKSVVGTFAFEGEETATITTEVSGTLSEALTGFRGQVMDHLTNYMKDKPTVGGGKTTVDANEDAFADNEEVEEDDVDKFLKGGKNKRQKT